LSTKCEWDIYVCWQSWKALIKLCQPSFCLYHCSFHWTDFFEIWHWGPSWKSVTKTNIWLKSEKILGTSHKDWIAFYCCWQHKYAIKALLCNTKYFHVVDLTCSSTKHRVSFCISVTKLFTSTCQNVTIYIQCLSGIKNVEVSIILIQIWLFLIGVWT